MRSPEEVEKLQTVTSWSRTNSPELVGFWLKARQLVTFARSKRGEKVNILGEGETPLKEDEIAKLEFTSSEKVIIEILQHYIYHHNAGYRQFGNPYELIVPSLIKPLRIYGDLNVQSVAHFLVDIGVWRSHSG